jgi:ribonuclease T2
MMKRPTAIAKCIPPLLALAAVALAFAPSAALAQRQEGANPGEFDFYVLSLSWSPSFCETAAERSPERVPQQQCGGRPYSFVVHGLWPQFERGFPERCQDPPPRLSRDIVSSMLDLMPARGLIYHEWDTHGTCSGLSASAFFDTVRKARAAIKIPAEFADLKETRTVAPQDVQDAFVKANPGASAAGVAVTCSGRRLSEVRICMTKDLHFRECPEQRRGACRRDQVVMPPVRGG